MNIYRFITEFALTFRYLNYSNYYFLFLQYYFIFAARMIIHLFKSHYSAIDLVLFKSRLSILVGIVEGFIIYIISLVEVFLW